MLATLSTPLESFRVAASLRITVDVLPRPDAAPFTKLSDIKLSELISKFSESLSVEFRRPVNKSPPSPSPVLPRKATFCPAAVAARATLSGVVKFVLSETPTERYSFI